MPPSNTPPSKESKDPRLLQSCWISASAGSGKTKVLIDQLLQFLVLGEPLSSILCLTYTNAAADEMKSRLQGKLLLWSRLDFQSLNQQLTDLLEREPSALECEQAKTLYTTFLKNLPDLHIETIHSFCSNLLNSFPFEMGLFSPIEIIQTSKSQNIIHQLLEENFYLLSQDPENQTKEQKILHRAFTFLLQIFPLERIEDLLQNLFLKKYDFAQFLKNYTLQGYHRFLQNKWPDDQIEDLNLSASRNFDEDLIQKTLASFEAASLTAKDLAVIQGLKKKQYLQVFLTSSQTLRKQLFSKTLKPQHKQACDVLEEQALLFFALVQKKQKDNLIKKTLALIELGKWLLNKYEHYKRTHYLFDFSDLIALTQEFLDKTAATPALHQTIFAQFPIRHIFLDEAQDTSPEQWQIVIALRKNLPGSTLFVVGDIKQSIYSFQGAKPQLFAFFKDFFKEQILQQSGNKGLWKELSLTKSYRTAPAILNVVDRVFANKEGMAFGSLHYQNHTSNRSESGWVQVIEVSAEKDENSQTPPESEQNEPLSPIQSLATATVQTIQKLLSDRVFLPSRQRVIQHEDILILTRKRNDLVQEVIKKLTEARIPVAEKDTLNLYGNLLWLDLTAFVRFLLFPHDNYTCACLLKSPLAAADFVQTSDQKTLSPEERLFQLCSNQDRKTAPPPSESSLFKSLSSSVLSIYYQEFLKAASTADFINFFNRVLSFIRPDCYKTFGATTDPIFEVFLKELSDFLSQHGPDFQLFLQHLENLPCKIKNPQSSRGIRFMTVHGSKGLQAPVVFVLDLPSKNPLQKEDFVWFPNSLHSEKEVKEAKEPSSFFSSEDPLKADCLAFLPPARLAYESLSKQRQYAAQKLAEEENRLLYVALTRAQDGLCMIGQNKKGSWFNMVSEAAQSSFEGHYEPCPSVYSLEKTREKASTNERSSSPFKLNLTTPHAFVLTTVPTILLSKKDDLESLQQKRGTLIHTLIAEMVQSIQISPSLSPSDLISYLQNKAQNFLQNSDLETKQKLFLDIPFEKIVKIAQLPEFKWLLKSQSEVTFCEHDDLFRLDYLAVEKDQAVIIEVKTSFSPESGPIPDSSQQQLSHYAYLVQQVFPGKTVRTFFLWADQPAFTSYPS